MNRIYTGFVTPTIQQPFTTGSLDFLQDAVLDQVNALCRSQIRSAGYTYSGTIPYQLVSQGGTKYVFFNGELFKMNPFVSGDIIVNIVVVNGTADPLTFTDNVPRNVHNVRILDPQPGTAGTGLFDYANIVDITTLNYATPAILNSWGYNLGYTVKYKQNQDQIILQGSLAKAANGTGIMFVATAPSITRLVPCVTIDAGTLKPNILNIDTSGNVSLGITTGTNVAVYLDGLSYSL